MGGVKKKHAGRYRGPGYIACWQVFIQKNGKWKDYKLRMLNPQFVVGKHGRR